MLRLSWDCGRRDRCRNRICHKDKGEEDPCRHGSGMVNPRVLGLLYR
jgi:hypothetical protein